MQQKHRPNLISLRKQLNEGLESGDLKDFISNTFSVDQFRSKMGEDKDVLVLGFRVKEKYPAIDLMEFIEKGYTFILDSDMSAGEEPDGQYQVFVELARTPQLSRQLNELLSDIGKACGHQSWRFRYHKANRSVPYTPNTVMEYIPMTPEDYDKKILEIKEQDVQNFFTEGATSVTLDTDNTLTFTKPYAGDLQARFIRIGDYEKVKDTVPGALSLDESSQSEILFLNKYLGNYEINKIGSHFLIRNGDKAMVIEKTRW